MKIAFRSVALVAVLLQLLAGTGVAHFGGEAFIVVTGNYVNPGQPFEVIVADLTSGSTVQLTAMRDGRPVTVGTAQADTEGHFSTSGTLPADFPHGYFELVATAGDGTRVSTWVLAGPPTSDSGSAPVPNATGGGIDPSLIVLILLLGGSVGAVGYLLIRRTKSVVQPGASRRAIPSKRSRRRARHV